MGSFLGLQICFHGRSPRGVCSIVIPAAFLYAEGLFFSFFSSSLRLLVRPTIMSPLQRWYLGTEYCLFLQCSYLDLRITSLIFLEGSAKFYPPHLYAEGCIVFAFQFVSKTHVWASSDVSAIVLIYWSAILSPQEYSYLDLSIVSSAAFS